MACRPLIPLNFQLAPFHRTSNPASLLELLAEALEVGGVCWDAVDHGNCLATSTLGLAPNTNHPVTGCGGPVGAANTGHHHSLALWTQPTAVRAVDRSRVRALVQLVLLWRGRALY